MNLLKSLMTVVAGLFLGVLVVGVLIAKCKPAYVVYPVAAIHYLALVLLVCLLVLAVLVFKTKKA